MPLELRAFKLEIGLLREIQQFADDHGLNFSAAVRELLREGLKARQQHEP